MKFTHRNRSAAGVANFSGISDGFSWGEPIINHHAVIPFSISQGAGLIDRYPYRSYAPERFRVLRGIVLPAAWINQNLPDLFSA